MADPETRHVPWRCLNCSERVDPTMGLCWNCGHDREGVAQPAMFIDAVDTDTSRCSRCAYELKGNPDALACPECGEPVPWVDCDACGVRTCRAAMADGCPVCRAKADGLAFVPEVVRKALSHCPQCRYDLRGLDEVRDCPECGRKIGQGVYDTVVTAVQSSDRRISSFVMSFVLMLVFCVLFPLGLLIVFGLSLLAVNGGAVLFLLVLLVAGLIGVGVMMMLRLIRSNSSVRKGPDQRRN